MASEEFLHQRSRLFTVRVWTEETEDGSQLRGRARDVAGGAFCGFRDWDELTAFLSERIEEERR